MAGTHSLVQVIKAELKAAGLTYADLAAELGMAESSVKRMLARGEMPLSRIDAICAVLKTDFAELARRVADTQPLRAELTLQQERAVVADRRLLLMAICCLSHWTLEQVLLTYTLTEAQAVGLLAQLDRLGILELRPLNRYRLRVAKGFRWRPHGPVMAYFRERVAPDFFSGSFAEPGDLLTLVHGQISRSRAPQFTERLQRVADDFAQQHLVDQRLPAHLRQGYTLVIGMRGWLFGEFRDLMREGVS